MLLILAIVLILLAILLGAFVHPLLFLLVIAGIIMLLAARSGPRV